MPLEGSDIVLYEKADQIVTITLNRPERLNSLTPESYERLDECWTEFQKDPDARVAILTGAGDRAFSTGADLKYRAEMVAKGGESVAKAVPHVITGEDPAGSPQKAGVDKPIIAAINGMAVAGGIELLLYCDLRIAASTAKIGIPEVRVGQGTPWAVPLMRQMPQAIGLQLLLTGESLDAERLYNVGWVNEVVPQEQLIPAARALAEKLRSNAPLSMAAAKKMWNKADESFYQTMWKVGKEIYKVVYESEDAKEGPRAFAEKRKPEWKGR